MSLIDLVTRLVIIFLLASVATHFGFLVAGRKKGDQKIIEDLTKRNALLQLDLEEQKLCTQAARELLNQN